METAKALRDRWKKIRVESVALNALTSPFGLVNGRVDFRGVSISGFQRLIGLELRSRDFSFANLAGIQLSDTRVSDCIFDKTDLSSSRYWNSDFAECRFLGANLASATLGSDGGKFLNCEFNKVKFTGASFIRPEFSSCSFIDCVLKKADFNLSQFDHCRFVGKLSDVRFNGPSVNPRLKQLFGEAPPNRMTHVDFSDAVFDYVSFDSQCDLTAVVPPKDGMHVYVPNLAAAVECVASKAPEDEDLRGGFAVWLPLLRNFAKTQSNYIVSGHDLSVDGERFAKTCLGLLRECAAT